jgi:hypothetical protein
MAVSNLDLVSFWKLLDSNTVSDIASLNLASDSSSSCRREIAKEWSLVNSMEGLPLSFLA